MVNISIDVTDLGGEARAGDKVTLWSPRVAGSASRAGGVVSTAPVTVFLTNGKATVSNVEPGDMRVLLQCRGVESQGPIDVTVPDGTGTVTLRSLIESQFEYSPPIVSAVQEAADNAAASERAAIQAQVRSERAADRAETRVDDAINNGAELVRDEVKQDADRAVSARQAATQSESNAAASENAAASSASNAADSESAAKQSETNAGDYAAVATTAATEAVDAMEVASEAASSIGDSVSRAAASADSASQSEANAAQYESSAATHAQNATEAATKVGTAAELDAWARAAQEAADRVGTAEQVGTWASEASSSASRATQSEINAKASEESADSSAIDAKASKDAASGFATEAGSHSESARGYAEQSESARDEVVPLAGQVASDASATAAHRAHVDYQVSAIDTAFTESVPTYLQPDALDERTARAASVVSVLEHGAEQTPANATAAFQSAIAEAASLGLTVYVPAGTWSVDPDSIVLSDNQKMIGAGHMYTTIVSSESYVGSGVTLSNGTELAGVFIRGYSEGVTTNGHWIKVHDVKLSYNTVGYHARSSSYICKVYNNDITFNRGIGVMVGGESYQFDLHHNIIDNNRGIGVLIYSTSGGVVVTDNTIEGNRDFTTGFGCGMYIIGSNISRLAIENNWFEANGNTDESVDVYFASVPAAPYHYIGTKILAELVPESHKSFVPTGSTGTGSMSIKSNAFIFTRNGLALSFAARATVSVRDNAFKGYLDRMNRHILLNLEPTIAYRAGTRLEISNNGYNNTDNTSGINPQVETGIGGTIVHAGKIYPEADMTYNGRPLFQKEMTFSEMVREFSWHPLRVFNSGKVPDPSRNLVTSGTPGYMASDNSAFVGTSITAGQLYEHGGEKIIVVAEPESRVRVQNTATWSVYNASPGYRRVSIIDLPETSDMVTGNMFANTGATIYGWFVVPEGKKHLLNGFSEVTITDWHSEPVLPTIPETV